MTLTFALARLKQMLVESPSYAIAVGDRRRDSKAVALVMDYLKASRDKLPNPVPYDWPPDSRN